MADDNTLSMSPVPQSAVQPTPAPGLKGPAGLSPRQNYSRVNTGVPGDVDAGALQQKSIMPKVGSVMSHQISMAARPRALNDMLKVAMESALSRSKIAAEAKKQLENLEGPEEKTADDKREKTSQNSSSALPTDYVLKLAAAADYIAEELSKEGADLAGPYKLTENIQGAGLGPNAIPVTVTMPEGPPHVIHTNSGQAATNKPPESTPLQKVRPQEHGATQMENDKDRAPGAGDAPVSGSTKNAAPLELLRTMRKQAGPEDLLAMGITPPTAVPAGPMGGGNLAGLAGMAATPQAAQVTPEVAAALQAASPEAAAAAEKPGVLSRMGGHLGDATKAVGRQLIGKGKGGLPGQLAAIGGAGLGAAGLGYGAYRAMGGGEAPMEQPGMTVQASAEAPIDLLRYLQKEAEDAINPAQISAGKAVPPEVSVTGTPGPAASGKDRVPSNYAGVAGLKRREAKSVPKAEMGKVLDEKMMSAAHDNVLQQAFTHTNEAGAKISSAHTVKVAAAKALLRNLANGGK